MSYTGIYRGKPGEQPEKIATIRNSWRGAVYAWGHVARKYHGHDSFLMLDEEARKQVWETYDTHDMPEHEHIVLLSTFDGAHVENKDLPRLIGAFRKFHLEHDRSSFGEQAKAIEALETPLDSDEFIFWNQTSVSADYFFCESEEGDGEYIQKVNLSKCFNIFGDMK